jgi:molecular chaperone GrpE
VRSPTEVAQRQGGPQTESDRTTDPREPWVARGRLRDALAEAVAAYASTETAANGAARAAVAGDPSASAVDAATGAGTGQTAAIAAECDRQCDRLQRLKAEFENYRKRVQRDNQALVLRAGEGVLESLLPVLDNMQRALESAQRHEEGQLIKGVEIVSGQLRSVLEGHGLDQVPAEPGLPFDPNIHEAVVAQESDEFDEGAIVAVLEPGYLLHGRLLRPARVVVAR